MADIKELDEAAKRQIAELNSTKIDLISALDRLVINEENNFNLPSHIGNNIPLSFRDNFNSYIYLMALRNKMCKSTPQSHFLKQSSHYQKLADQSYQTQVELQALPSFIANISSIESAELIRKELALKYFGKDVDGAPHKDMSNLINDQMKSTTELVKATTNIVKKQ